MKEDGGRSELSQGKAMTGGLPEGEGERGWLSDGSEKAVQTPLLPSFLAFTNWLRARLMIHNHLERVTAPTVMRNCATVLSTIICADVKGNGTPCNEWKECDSFIFMPR